MTSEDLTHFVCTTRPMCLPELERDPALVRRLDELAELSAKHQGLRSPLTTVVKLKANSLQGAFVGQTLIGYALFGQRSLYMNGETSGRSWPCLFDFFVHVDYRSQGVGRKLLIDITALLGSPKELAVDRPSPDMCGFGFRYSGMKLEPQYNRFSIMRLDARSGSASTVASRSDDPRR